MGYTVAGIEQLAKNYNGSIVLIEDVSSKLTPYTFNLNNIIYKTKNSFVDKAKFVEYCLSLNAEIVLCTGWIDKEYNTICRKYYVRHILTVCMFDTQWCGSLRQYLAKLFAPIYIKKIFNVMWGSGLRQYEFAKRLGYDHKNIKIGFYTCDYGRYSKVNNTYDSKNILFLGRFVKVKGIDILLRVFDELRHDFKDWTLTLVGNGSLETYSLNDQVIVKDFKQPDELVDEFANASIFCLPSNFEPWGVVIHEAAAAGLPILCSLACGASDSFVRQGYNGYLFEDETDLKYKLKLLMSKNSRELKIMGENSRKLSHDFTPEIWSSTVLSLLKNG
jgi:glycosyltransferase involved in cell wall biosynthesis